MPVCNVTRAFGFMWPDDNWPHLRRTTDILLLNHRKHSGRLEWTKIFRSQRNTTVCTFTLTCFRGLALVWLVAVLIYLHETHTHTNRFFFGHYSHLTLTTQVLEDRYLIHVNTDVVILSTLCIGCVDISTFMLYRFFGSVGYHKGLWDAGYYLKLHLGQIILC